MRKILVLVFMVLTACSGPEAQRGAKTDLPFVERVFRHMSITSHPCMSTEGAPRLSPQASHLPCDNTITWLGHASFLLRMDGQTLLLDPVLSDDIHGWLSDAGRRLVPQAPMLEYLTHVDAIVISHGHSDHANNETLRLLARRFPDTPVIAPEGLVPLLSRIGARRIRPVAQFTPTRVGPLTLTAVPVRHDQVLFAIDPPRDAMPSAWVIEDGRRRIYFAGDNAYGPHGKETAARFGRMSLALLPIGSYSPPELFHRAHETPEEAARFARDLGAAMAIGHHWGTYAWGEETPAEVRARFLATAAPGFRPVLLDIGAPMPLP